MQSRHERSLANPNPSPNLNPNPNPHPRRDMSAALLSHHQGVTTSIPPQMLPQTRTRFCAQPLPIRSRRSSRIVRVPMIYVEQLEAAVHPSNLGHFFRDVSFLASMLNEVRGHAARRSHAHRLHAQAGKSGSRARAW